MDGTLSSNNSTITGILGEGETLINGGEYGSLFGIFTVNDATIQEIKHPKAGAEVNNSIIKDVNLQPGGTININSGTIERILLADDGGGIHLTIGNLGDAVSTTNPVIEEIVFRTDLAAIYEETQINFYNGIVKSVSGIVDILDDNFYTSLRTGYKTQITTEGAILVVE